MRAVAPEPVNVLIGPTSRPVPLAELSAAGGTRVSLGGALYRVAMGAVAAAAARLAAGDMTAGNDTLPGRTIAGLLP